MDAQRISDAEKRVEFFLTGQGHSINSKNTRSAPASRLSHIASAGNANSEKSEDAKLTRNELGRYDERLERKLLPENAEAERAVIGAIFCDPNALYNPTGILSEKHFTSRRNGHAPPPHNVPPNTHLASLTDFMVWHKIVNLSDISL